MENQNRSEIDVPWGLRDTFWGLLLALVLLLLLILGLALLPPENLNLGAVLGLGGLLYLLPVWWFTLRKYGVSWRALGLRGFEMRELAIAFGVLLASYTVIIVYSLSLETLGVEIPNALAPALEAGISEWWLVLGAALFLGEKVGWRRWARRGGGGVLHGIRR